MAALRGRTRCYNHSSQTASKRAVSRRKGGARRRVPNATAPVPVATITELQVHLGQALADALVHENSLKRSMVVTRLVMAAAKLIEDGEIEERFEMIEERLRAMEKQR